MAAMSFDALNPQGRCGKPSLFCLIDRCLGIGNGNKGMANGKGTRTSAKGKGTSERGTEAGRETQPTVDN